MTPGPLADTAHDHEHRDLLATRLYWGAALVAVAWAVLAPAAIPAPSILLVVVPVLLLARHLDSKWQNEKALARATALSLDVLTGLASRRLFIEELKATLAEPTRKGEVTAVFYLDIDRFKAINDTLGHTVGDRFLMVAADRLRASTPPGAVIARLGGDEFTILLPRSSGRTEVIETANGILKAFDTEAQINGEAVWANVSIGVVYATTPRPLADDFLSMADSALHQAKTQGKGRFVLFEPHMPRPTPRTLPLELDLRSAPSTNQLVLHYQPIVDLGTLQIAGFEALVRWNHPRLGLLSPADFIHLAEETGLIREMGEWIIERACSVTSAWQSMHGRPLTISVNLSALQFRQADLLGLIGQSVRKAGLIPGSLQLEITETVLMRDDSTTMENLHGLRDLGVAIAIDDFGIGYSSLSYLKLFEVDVLKIDRSFVSSIEDARSYALTKAICQLGQTLGHRVIAEGIETTAQLEALRSFGCDLGQGYLLGRPVDAVQITDLLAGGGLNQPVKIDHVAA